MHMDEGMNRFIPSIDETFHSRGRKVTPQREMIWCALREADEHLSASQIFKRVQERNPCTTLATVYRTLEVLQEVGLAREVRLPGEKTKYKVLGTLPSHVPKA